SFPDGPKFSIRVTKSTARELRRWHPRSSSKGGWGRPEPVRTPGSAMRFSMRFDFRNPSFADTSTADRYAAALDMAEWADEHGCFNIGTCEHHGSPDGYIPSPIVIVSAMAPRTSQVRFMIAALLAPFHDPLRLAEDLCVLDNVTKGRLDLVVAAGYAREEFEMFDRSMKDRPKQVVEVVKTLRSA